MNMLVRWFGNFNQWYLKSMGLNMLELVELHMYDNISLPEYLDAPNNWSIQLQNLAIAYTKMFRTSSVSTEVMPRSFPIFVSIFVSSSIFLYSFSGAVPNKVFI